MARPPQVPLGVYVRGPSPIHRIPAGLTILLSIGMIVLGNHFATGPASALLFFATTALVYALARIPVGVMWSQAWPPLPFIAALGLLRLWQDGPAAAATVVIALWSSVLVGCLVTLTSTTAEIMASLERGLSPLRRCGIPVERLTLTISLTLRLIPVMLATASEVLEARKARGVGFSLSAFAAPMLIRAMRRADLLAEALIARGAGDEET